MIDQEQVPFRLEVSASALKRIQYLKTRQAEANYLRIAVESGGCSGLQYKYEFVSLAQSDDVCIEKQEVVLLIDSISQKFLHDSVLDYIEELGNAYFEIRNPKARAKCGCGNSFTV